MLGLKKKETDLDLIREKIRDASRKKRENSATASFGAVATDGRIYGHWNAGCHLNLKRITNAVGKLVFLNTVLGRPKHRNSEENRALFIRYVNFLINDSPVARYIENTDAEEAEKNGLMIPLAGLRANLVAFICVLSRTSYEELTLSRLKSWARLVDNGVDEWLAVALSGRILDFEKVKGDREGETHLKVVFSHSMCHHPFCQNVGEKGLRRILNREGFDEAHPANERSDKAEYSLAYNGMQCAITGENKGSGDGSECHLKKLLAHATEHKEVGGRDLENLNPWGRHPPLVKFETLNFEKLNERAGELRGK